VRIRHQPKEMDAAAPSRFVRIEAAALPRIVRIEGKR
jgi:hypothetical protein